MKASCVISPLPSLPTRLLFPSPWSLEILEPASKSYLLSPRYYGALTAMVGPTVLLKSLSFLLPVDCNWSNGATASPSSDSILLSPSKSIHTPCTAFSTKDSSMLGFVNSHVVALRSHPRTHVKEQQVGFWSEDKSPRRRIARRVPSRAKQERARDQGNGKGNFFF